MCWVHSGRVRQADSILCGTDAFSGVELPNLVLFSDVPPGGRDFVGVNAIVVMVSGPESKNAVLMGLGLPDTFDKVLSSDLWEELESGDSEAAAQQRVNAQISVLFNIALNITDAFDKSEAVTVTQAVSVAIIGQIQVQQGGVLDLSDEGVIYDIFRNTLSGYGTPERFSDDSLTSSPVFWQTYIRFFEILS